MKAKILTIALTAGVFALVACRSEVKTTTIKEVNAEATEVAQGVSDIVETATEEVEPATEPAPAPVEP